MDAKQLTSLVTSQGVGLYRPMPWRNADPDGSYNVYKILVSEYMLQQTQVGRVIPKYIDFVARFPSCKLLAQADSATVLSLWNGLGYNKRGLRLWQAAKSLQGKKYWQYDDLINCSGVGPNTAKAVLTYAYDQPHAFVETNIRTVIIHYMFAHKEQITDKEILHVMEQCLAHVKSPRQWYWALMDVGAQLKQSDRGIAKKSSSYKPQPRFEGSRREVRGAVMRQLLQGSSSFETLKVTIPDERLLEVLHDLEHEELISQSKGRYYLGHKT